MVVRISPCVARYTTPFYCVYPLVLRDFGGLPGPSFDVNVTVETMGNRDVYSILCHSLDVLPAPNNGSTEGMQGHLKARIQFN